MPRLSRADIMTLRHGGKWKFNYKDTWHCDDGIRFVYLGERNCICWSYQSKCTCKRPYIMNDGEKEYKIDLEHPYYYKKQGIRTK